MTAKDWIEVIGITAALILSVLSFFPDLRQKFATLRSTAAQERSSDASAYNNLVATVTQLSDELKDSIVDQNALRQKLDIERAERVKLQEQVANSQVALGVLSDELAAARTAVQELESELRAEQEARRAIEQEMIRTTERVRVLEHENVILKEENADLREALSAYQEGNR